MKKLATVIMLLLLLTACERRPLWVSVGATARMQLQVSWQGFTAPKPTGMTAVFYPRDGRQPIELTTADVDATDVFLPVGVYDVVLFNQSPAEFSNEEFRGMDRFATSEVALLPLLRQPRQNDALYAPMRAQQYVTTRTEVFESPEPMALDTLRNLVVTDDMVDRSVLVHWRRDGKYSRPDDRSYIISMAPRDIVWTLYVTVRIRGIKNLGAVRASIQGLAEGHLLGLHRQNLVSVYHALNEWNVYRDDDVFGHITTSLRTFGMMGKDEFLDSDVRLNLQVLLADMVTIREYHYDVANRIEVFPDRLVLNLVIDADDIIPDLPDVEPNPGNASGFGATVEDWDEETVEISM